MKAMTQKIQEFKSLEIPKTHRQLEEVIETIKNTQRKISSANRKLCKLRARLSRKKSCNRYSYTVKIEHAITSKEMVIRKLYEDLKILEETKINIASIKDKKIKEAQEIFKDEISSLGLEDYRVSIQVDAYSVNFYFNKREGQKSHGHYKIDFSGKLIYRREIHQRRSKKCHVF